MSRRRIEVNLKPECDLMELEAYGVTNSAEAGRPVMLFRRIGGEEILPVYLTPLDAGIAISQHGLSQQPHSPHDVPLRIMEKLGLKLERCDFTEVKGHHQFVKLSFSGNRKMKTLLARADQAISFSLHARARFFCTKKYIEDSRVITAEMASTQRDLKRHPGATKNRHPYLN